MTLTFKSCGADLPTVHESRYLILEAAGLPDDVADEICNDCPANDTGRIVNPQYHPKLKRWLEENGLAVQCYIVWWSW